MPVSAGFFPPASRGYDGGVCDATRQGAAAVCIGVCPREEKTVLVSEEC